MVVSSCREMLVKSHKLEAHQPLTSSSIYQHLVGHRDHEDNLEGGDDVNPSCPLLRTTHIYLWVVQRVAKPLTELIP